MWSDRSKQDNSFSRTYSGPGGPNERASEAAGAVSNLAVIGKGMVIRGQITSRESMYVDGEVTGSFQLFDCRLTIGPNGRVDANIKAREIEILGRVSGDIEASKKITVRRGGRLMGDLRTPGIVIEEGAYYKGKIEIVSSEEHLQFATAEPKLRSVAGA
jgi:cytoskeletal protein CcmA (bactofilin family)